MGVCPWHELIDVVGEVSFRELRKKVAQICKGFDAVHLAWANETGKALPVAAALVISCKKRIAAVYDRAADSVYDNVVIDVDAPVIENHPAAVITHGVCT